MSGRTGSAPYDCAGRSSEAKPELKSNSEIDMEDLIKKLKKLRSELAFGADEEAASLVGEAISAIENGHKLAVQRCADAIVMCPECNCTAMSRKAILALAVAPGGLAR